MLGFDPGQQGIQVMALRPVYQVIASKLQAMANCVQSGNEEWHAKHGDAIARLMKAAPSGGGFDAGTEIDFDASTTEKLVFSTSFHHMTEHGYYGGWTEHNVIVTPSLTSGFNLRVTGRDRNDIKEYIGELFHEFLAELAEEYSGDVPEAYAARAAANEGKPQ
jgi:hypothetical protein